MSFISDVSRTQRKCIFFALMTTSFLLTSHLFQTPAHADNDAIWLPGIVVYSANKTPTDLAKVGSDVEVITEEDLKKTSQKYVKDYLETLPGVNFSQSGGAGKITTLNIRGAGAGYVKVLIDGIDISDPSDIKTSAPFEHLLTGDVSRIELLKGSQGTLYGGNAVGGVINITTKTAIKQGFSQSASGEYGAYNTKNGSYTAGYAGDKGNISLTVQGTKSDGFSAADERNGNTEDDGYENLTLSSRGEYKFNDVVSMFFALRSVHSENEIDGYNDFFVLDDTDDLEKARQNAGRVGVNVNLLDGKFQNTFAIQGSDTERQYYDKNGTNSYNGDRFKAEYQGVYHFNKNYSVLFGTDWEKNGAEVDYNLPFNKDMDRTTTDVIGTFAQLNLEPVKNLNFTIGGRHDEHSTFNGFDTYRLTGAYLFSETNTKIRGSLGTGFRAPSLFELYDPNYGAEKPKELDPEESKSWDVGVEQGLFRNKAKVGMTYFNLDTENLISYHPTTFRSFNIKGVTERHGVELFGSAQLHEMLSISTSYTYTDTETEKGDRLVRVPKHMVTVGVDIKPTEKLSLNVTAKFVRDTVDYNDSFIISPIENYVLLNAIASYELQPGLDLYVRGENLLNEDYQTVYGYGTSDLAVYAGLKWTMDAEEK